MDTRTSCKSPWGVMTGGPVLAKLALRGLEWNSVSRHRRAAEREVRYLHTFYSHSIVALDGGCGEGVTRWWWSPGPICGLSVAFHIPTIEGAGEQATQSWGKVRQVPCFFQPRPRPDQNRGRTYGTDSWRAWLSKAARILEPARPRKKAFSVRCQAKAMS